KAESHARQPGMVGNLPLVHHGSRFFAENARLSVAAVLQVGDHEMRHVGGSRDQRSGGNHSLDRGLGWLELPVVKAVSASHIGRGGWGRNEGAVANRKPL